NRPQASTSAALAVTLKDLEDLDRATLSNPTLTLLSAPLANLRQRAERLAPQIAESPAVAAAEVVEVDATSAVIAGLPFEEATFVIAVTPAEGSAEQLAERLATRRPGVQGRIEDAAGEPGRLLLDLRTVLARQDLTIVSAFPPLAEEPPSEADSAT
ncbi:MAG: hypothetical protein AAGB00_11875, partial [Planctomycetota bacterium]